MGAWTKREDAVGNVLEMECSACGLRGEGIPEERIHFELFAASAEEARKAIKRHQERARKHRGKVSQVLTVVELDLRPTHRLPDTGKEQHADHGAPPARAQSPDFPPVFSSRHTSPMTMSRSTALHMS